MNSKLYTIPSTVMIQVVDDETLLYDSATGLFFALNETGAMMWDSIARHDDLKDVHVELMDVFEVESDQLTSDMKVFVDLLAEQGLINFDTAN